MADATQELEVVVNPHGHVSIRARGFDGKSCLEATASLEKKLGKVKKRDRTKEYYAAEAEKETDRAKKKEKTSSR